MRVEGVLFSKPHVVNFTSNLKMESMMKKIWAIFMCFLSFEIHTLEYEQQFENDQVCIAKVKISPHEEIGLHRDVYPQVVIALKGGTMTRLEADGRTTDITFPTGTAVFREADPENELHKSVNNSSESIELILVQVKNNTPSVSKKVGEISHDIAVDIRINCPESDELKNFVRSIPKSDDNYSGSFEEWKNSFKETMTQLIRLVDSEKTFNSILSIKTDYSLSQASDEN
jgi:hypothetical protein